MPNPLVCFKYRTPERALQSLKEGTLYFAKSSVLNDTLEAKYDHASPEDFIRVYVQTMSEISQQRGGPALEFDQQGMSDMTAANVLENKNLQNSTDQIGIFSAARRPDHQAMWAYYADNCNGFCFELALSHEVASRYHIWQTDVHYQGTARVHNSAEDWREVILEIAREHPGASMEEVHHLALDVEFRGKYGIITSSRAVSVKHTDWAHEQEIRLLTGKSGALPILSDVLKCVYFVQRDGHEMGEKWGEIMRYLYSHYPSVEIKQLTFCHGAFTVTSTPMEFRLIPL